jgi:hypothetical protein
MLKMYEVDIEPGVKSSYILWLDHKRPGKASH